MKRTLKKSMLCLIVAVIAFTVSQSVGFVDHELFKVGGTKIINEFVSAFSSFAIKAEATDGYYSYRILYDSAMITDVDTTISGDISIPSTLGKYPVAYIGEYAFYNCDSITSLTIPNSIVSIKENAFDSCTQLTNVEIGSRVVTISSEVFKDCTSLTSITIGNDVEEIGKDAFDGCSSLENVYYRGELFDWCKIIFYNSLSNPMWYAKNLYIKDVLLEGAVQIPNTLSIIRDYTFLKCEGLTNITISDNIENIGKSAFYECINLESVAVASNVTSIGTNAFSSCKNLQSVIFEKDSRLKSIENGAFGYCYNLAHITVPDSVKTIGDYAFSYCVSLTSITITDKVTCIGNDAFRECKSLANVTIGNGITSIEEGAFTDCYNLQNVYYTGNLAEWCNINFVSRSSNPVFYAGNLYVNSDLLVENIVISNNVTSIGKYVFGNCDSITSVIINNSVTSIDDSAFFDCDGITSVTINNGVTSIGDSAFSNCDSITKIIIPDSIISLGNRAFSNCDSLTSVSIGNSVTSVGDDTFSYCKNLISITIPDSVTNIGDDAFAYCHNLENVYYNGELNGWCNINFDSDESNPMAYASNLFINGTPLNGNIVIPDTITSIGKYTFYNCDNLMSITVPNSVISISNNAFYFCDGLTSIIIPNSVAVIGQEAFGYCVNLIDIYYVGTEDEWNTITIGDYNEPLLSATIHYNYVPGSEPTTTKPATTKPAVVPTTAKPATTKPATTKPTVVPTTKPTVPSTTKPTTTKPAVEEENIKKPSTSTVNYGETLILHINASSIPENAKIEWSVDGEGVTLKPSADGKTCAVTSTATGDVTVTAKYVDSNGVEHISEQEIKSNAGLWQKIVSFFKNLFGMNRVIEQRIKFN